MVVAEKVERRDLPLDTVEVVLREGAAHPTAQPIVQA